jgi:hypothetical protein
MTFAGNGRGEFAFGVVNATMELEYGRHIVFFTWSGFDEGDEVRGSGSAELEDDGTVEIELSFQNGDDAILKAYASAVMRFRPAHHRIINRRFDDRASCPARKSSKQALASKPRIHSPASGNGGHESGSILTA